MKSIITKNSTVGIITPSWAGPNMFPDVYQLGLDRLRNVFGLKIKEYPFTLDTKDALSQKPQKRAEDVMLAFEDKETDLIIASIGGNDSIRILPYLDIERIKKNPKPLMGFSDTTTLLTYLSQNGIITIHGPSVMAGFAEPVQLPEEFIKHFNSFFFEPWSSFEYKKYDLWTESKSNWSDSDFAKNEKDYKQNLGWKIIQGQGSFSGKLYGGNLEIFEMMKGTKFMEDVDFLQGKVLFLETSEEKPSVSYIRYALRSMGVRGVFDKISGLLFGRAKGYSDEEKESIYKTIQKIIKDEFKKDNLPVVANMDFGHTQPQWIMPMGADVSIDLNSQSFKIIKNPFID